MSRSSQPTGYRAAMCRWMDNRATWQVHPWCSHHMCSSRYAGIMDFAVPNIFLNLRLMAFQYASTATLALLCLRTLCQNLLDCLSIKCVASWSASISSSCCLQYLRLNLKAAPSFLHSKEFWAISGFPRERPFSIGRTCSYMLITH